MMIYVMYFYQNFYKDYSDAIYVNWYHKSSHPNVNDNSDGWDLKKKDPS